MFHTYITAKSGRRIDIDRARLIMDDTIFQEVHASVVRRAYPNGFGQNSQALAQRIGNTRDHLAQLIWVGYCQRHFAKYGSPFEPDESQTWDA